MRRDLMREMCMNEFASMLVTFGLTNALDKDETGSRLLVPRVFMGK